MRLLFHVMGRASLAASEASLGRQLRAWCMVACGGDFLFCCSVVVSGVEFGQESTTAQQETGRCRVAQVSYFRST
jgi:hypothetical protein